MKMAYSTRRCINILRKGKKYDPQLIKKKKREKKMQFEWPTDPKVNLDERNVQEYCYFLPGWDASRWQGYSRSMSPVFTY